MPTDRGTTTGLYKETEAAPSEEKGILSSAKEAIVSAVSGGIETVKELIHDVGVAFEGEGETKEEARQNPESPPTKEPILKKIPFVSTITSRYHEKPKRHEKKPLTKVIKEAAMKTLPTEEETPQKEKQFKIRKGFDSEWLMEDYRETHIPMIGISLPRNKHYTIRQK